MSRPKLYFLLFINYGFVVSCLFTHYTFGLLFFGFGAAVWTYCLLRPSSRLARSYKIQPGPVEPPRFEQLYNDCGQFTYTDHGFSYPTATGVHPVAWSAIQAMFGYKRDQYVTDLVCLDIFFTNGQGISLHEETPGWYQFVRRLPAHFPSIKPGWEIELTFPAFATNLTLIYERDGRSLPQAEAMHYRT